MTHDCDKRAPVDRERINFSDRQERRWWSDYYAVTEEHLTEAVEAVGTHREDVRRYLDEWDLRIRRIRPNPAFRGGATNRLGAAVSAMVEAQFRLAVSCDRLVRARDHSDVARAHLRLAVLRSAAKPL